MRGCVALKSHILLPTRFTSGREIIIVTFDICAILKCGFLLGAAALGKGAWQVVSQDPSMTSVYVYRLMNTIKNMAEF